MRCNGVAEKYQATSKAASQPANSPTTVWAEADKEGCYNKFLATGL